MVEPPVIISVGAVSPLGQSWERTWENLLGGANHSAPLNVSHPDARGIEFEVGAVPGLDRDLKYEHDVTGAAARLAAMAGRAALAQTAPSLNDAAIQLFGGSTHGESDLIIKLLKQPTDTESTSSNALWRALLLDPLPRAIAREISPRVKPGPWVYSACTSGLHALILAILSIQAQREQRAPVLVIGVDALSLLGVAGFIQSKAGSRTSCRPFQAGCDGTVVSEGAAAVVVGNRKDLPSSGPQPVRVLGFAQSADAFDPTRPHPAGIGIERAMRGALAHAAVDTAAVKALVLHGSGTPANDEVEAAAVRRLFGDATPPCTSLKGAMGHTMAAAGLFNVLAAWSAMHTGLLPPTGCAGASVIGEIDVVLGEPRKLARDGAILVNASGFGGNNVSVLVG